MTVKFSPFAFLLVLSMTATVGLGGFGVASYESIDDLNDEIVVSSVQMALNSVFENEISAGDWSVELVSIPFGVHQIVNGTNYYMCVIFKSPSHAGTLGHIKFWISTDQKSIEIHEFDIPRVQFLYGDAEVESYPILTDIDNGLALRCSESDGCTLNNVVKQYQKMTDDLSSIGVEDQNIEIEYACVSYQTSITTIPRFFAVLESSGDQKTFNISDPNSVDNLGEPTQEEEEIQDGENEDKTTNKRKYINSNAGGGFFLTIIVSAMLGSALTYAIIFFFWKKNKRLPCSKKPSDKEDKEKLFDLQDIKSHN